MEELFKKLRITDERIKANARKLMQESPELVDVFTSLIDKGHDCSEAISNCEHCRRTIPTQKIGDVLEVILHDYSQMDVILNHNLEEVEYHIMAGIADKYPEIDLVGLSNRFAFDPRSPSQWEAAGPFTKHELLKLYAKNPKGHHKVKKVLDEMASNLGEVIEYQNYDYEAEMLMKKANAAIDLIVTHKDGLHMRPIAHVVKAFSGYEIDEARLLKGNTVMNPISFMSIMMGVAEKGTEIRALYFGDDVKRFKATIESLVKMEDPIFSYLNG